MGLFQKSPVVPGDPWLQEDDEGKQLLTDALGTRPAAKRFRLVACFGARQTTPLHGTR
jgi:hypothetical protein